MNRFLIYLLLLFSFVGLHSCADNVAVKPDEVSNESENASKYSGHLTTQDQFSQDSVPATVNARPFNVAPTKEHIQSLYSLTAIDSPVQDILYHLAEKTGYQIDIWQGVEGQLTINAVNQPLKTILQRIADQLSLIIDVQHGQIIAKPDAAYWKHYRVDYVNIKRSSRDSIVMNMTVGGSINPVAGGQATGSRSSVEVSSDHDFWTTLHTTLLSMVAHNSPSTLSTASAAGTTTPPAPLLASLQPVAAGMAGTSPQPVQGANTKLPVVINPEAGLVLVFASDKSHQQVQHYLDNVSASVERQVMIEASVVEVVLSEQHQSGIDWSSTGFKNLSNRRILMAAPGATPMSDNIFTANLGSDVGADFSLGLKMLEKFGDVQVLSSPKIMAVNNQSALLKVVDNDVYFTVNVSRSTSTAGTDITYSTTVHTVPVGFMMSMTPFVNDKREISLNIRPTISRVIGRVADPNPDLKAVGVESLIPVVQEREMETVLKLRDQQTAVIGGLIEDRQDKIDSGLPWLSRIPILGKLLFGYKEASTSKIELVIFIRPVIVDRPDIHSGDLTQFQQFLRQRSENQ